MHITGSDRRNQLCCWAEDIYDLIRQDDPTAAAAIVQALSQFREGRFLVTVLGKAKRGKSTLVNALLGRRDDELAPIDKLPASNVISRFVRSEQSYARVYYRSMDHEASELIPTDRIRDYVTEEGNPHNTKNVEAVEIGGPFPEFDHDLTIVDTPGAGSIHQYHDELLQAFIPQSDAVIFLVTAGMPIDRDELDLLKKIKAADIAKVIFAINKVDAAPQADVEAAVTHNRSCLAQAGIVVEEIHRLSAKRAFHGELKSSGLESLIHALRRTIADQKGRILAERFIRRIVDAASPSFRARDLELTLAEAAPAEIQQKQMQLAAARQRLADGDERLPKIFLRHWNGALDTFRANAVSAGESVKSTVAEVIHSSSLLGVNQLTRDLPGLIQQSIDEVLTPYAAELERQLQQACRDLNASYRELTTDLHAVAMRPRHDPTLIAGAATAAASIAAGVGIVSAGQAATAAAVAYVTTPTVVGGLLQTLIGTTGGYITSTAVPAAAPAWVALAAPLGWTVAGIGSLAIPFAWALAKSKQKVHLEAEAVRQTDTVFHFIVEERIPLLRRTADCYVEEFQARTEHELSQLEEGVRRVGQPTDPAALADRRRRFEQFKTLLEGPTVLPMIAAEGHSVA